MLMSLFFSCSFASSVVIQVMLPLFILCTVKTGFFFVILRLFTVLAWCLIKICDDSSWSLRTVNTSKLPSHRETQHSSLIIEHTSLLAVFLYFLCLKTQSCTMLIQCHAFPTYTRGKSCSAPAVNKMHGLHLAVLWMSLHTSAWRHHSPLLDISVDHCWSQFLAPK